MRTSNRSTTMIGGALAAAALFVSVLGPATAHAEPQGYIQGEFPVGYVYGTFDADPDNQYLTLLVGGTAEEFCLNNDDPFEAEPGTAPVRVFPRKDGTVDLKVNDKDQPIYLYKQEMGDPFAWMNDIVCPFVSDAEPDKVVVEPYAEGTADLKVRLSLSGPSESDPPLDIFNSVNGELIASDGAKYRVRASADITFVDGAPVGDPADFVSFNLKKIGR